MIKPTVGRVVLYNPGPEDPFGAVAGGDAQAAIICHVLSDDCVNLAVFGPNGVQYSRTSVYLRQEGGSVPFRPYAEWMPYQIGQAKKTEELQRQLEDTEGGDHA